jgi:hypothetical protein
MTKLDSIQPSETDPINVESGDRKGRLGETKILDQIQTRAGGPPRTRSRRFWPLVGGILLVLFAAEFALRLAGVRYPTGGQELFFTWDPHTGVAPRPGAEGFQPTADGYVFVRINSQGLRDREHSLAKPPNTFRIAVLGDSYTEALQVPMEKDFSSVLERELTGCASLNGQTPEVINFGVNSFTTAQELITLREKVWQYSPDLVILAFDSGNNPHKNSRALQQDPYRPYFVEKDGKLELDDSFLTAPGVRSRRPLNNAVSWGIRESRLMGVAAAGINYVSKGNVEGLTPGGMGLDPALYHEPTDQVWKDAWQVTEDLIAQTRDEVQAKAAKFLLVTLSSSIQVDPDPAVRQDFINRLKITDLFYPEHRLQRLAGSKGIAILTLAPQLQQYAEQHKAHLHGGRTADHQGLLNQLGHQVAGQIMAQKVCSEILPAPRTAALTGTAGGRH